MVSTEFDMVKIVGQPGIVDGTIKGHHLLVKSLISFSEDLTVKTTWMVRFEHSGLIFTKPLPKCI